jgi:hypothetical protein
MTLTSYTSIDGAWKSTFSQICALATGTSLFPRNVELQMCEGRLSEERGSPHPVSTLRIVVSKKVQVAAHGAPDVRPRSVDAMHANGVQLAAKGTW